MPKGWGEQTQGGLNLLTLGSDWIIFPSPRQLIWKIQITSKKQSISLALMELG